MKLSDFDYYLPSELIAHAPLEDRSSSRLLVVNRSNGEIVHDRFDNLFKYLPVSDNCFVFNNTKVLPFRLYGKKDTGGNVEVLLLGQRDDKWKYIGKNIKRARRIIFERGLMAEICEGGLLKFNVDNTNLLGLISQIGYIPLPPYIHNKELALDTNKTQRIYNTVYADIPGSAAAPTAGLHFTNKMIDEIENKVFVRLDVSLGTFLGVKTDNIYDHKMHSEYYEISEKAMEKIESDKKMGKKIVAVGTTSLRTIESFAKTGILKGETDIFITPGFEFGITDHLVTNFHLPKSTLIMLLCAFAGRELVMKAYEEAIKEKYRFFSFGDAMLVI